MKGLLIVGTFVAVVMFICSIVYKFVLDAHSRAENARRKATEKSSTEDLKNRYK